MTSQRRLEVLRAIVSDYVEKREPVGSKAIVERHNLGVSPATVRNDMAYLEDAGYIHQPHTSSGRIPTDKGYRLFVDQLHQIKPLSGAERRAITSLLEGASDIEEVLARAVRLLAQLTHQTAVVQFPAMNQSKVRALEVVSLGAHKALLVIIADSGRVDQRLCEFSTTGYTPQDFEIVSRELSSWCVGKSATQITEELRQSETFATASGLDIYQKQLLETLARNVVEAFSFGQSEARMIVAGIANLARSDEDFVRSITPVVEALEEQVVLLKLFSQMKRQSSVNVSIGREIGVDALSETSLVASAYDASNTGRAHVGVVGPTRMNYPASIAAVQAVASYLNEIIS